MACVLDTSALIAFLRQEHGWQLVADYLVQDAYFSEVNRAEFYTYMVRNGQTVENAQAILDKTEVITVNFDEAQAAATAILYPAGRAFGLSLGDRACLALAMIRSLTVITADKVWRNLDIGVDVTLIRS